MSIWFFRRNGAARRKLYSVSAPLLTVFGLSAVMILEIFGRSGLAVVYWLIVAFLIMGVVAVLLHMLIRAKRK